MGGKVVDVDQDSTVTSEIKKNRQDILEDEKNDFYKHRNVERYVWKNVIFMSLSFMLNYTAYSGLSGLQSSLHIVEGMGVICTSIRYISLVISTFFVPELMIRTIGHRWTVTASLIGFILWMAANGYGVWATMIPASIINGVFVAPLWAAQGSYFTEISKIYATATNSNQEGIIAKLFGVFYMFYLGAAVFGNIISTTVLKAAPPENYTALTDEEADMLCGMNDCPQNQLNNTNLEKPPSNIVWTLVGIYIIIATCAILMSIFLVDNLPRFVSAKADDDDLPMKKKFVNIMTATVKLMRKKKLWLLVPLTFYTGIEETFFFAEYNRSWITCALGIWMVGIINVPFGFTSAVIAYFCGTLTKKFGRLPLIFTALILDVSTQFTIAFWIMKVEETWFYYLISFIWGLYDGIWLTISSALYGVIFPNDSEAAYSNYMCWQCLGYATAFGYSYFICTDVKVYIMFACLVVGIICYFILEFEHQKTENQSVIISEMQVIGQENSFDNIKDMKRQESFVYTNSAL